MTLLPSNPVAFSAFGAPKMSSPAPVLADAKLGVAADFALHNSQDNRLAALRMIQQAQRTVHVFSRDLEPRIYDDAEMTSALSALARRHRSSHVRLLVADVGPAQRNGHRWLELVQKLSSKIDVRVIHDDHLHHPFSFLVADQSGLLYRSNAVEYAGEAHFHAPLLCLEKLKLFDEIWQISRPATELRRLFI